MASFKDNKGASWKLQLDPPTIKDIRDTFSGLDLADRTGKVHDLLAEDQVLCVDVLYVICREQCEERGISDLEFGRLCFGDVFDSIIEALIQATIDFFPRRKRELLTATIRLTEERRQRAESQAFSILKDPALEKRALDAVRKQMEEAVEQSLIRLSSPMNTPASSESAPAA